MARSAQTRRSDTRTGALTGPRACLERFINGQQPSFETPLGRSALHQKLLESSAAILKIGELVVTGASWTEEH